MKLLSIISLRETNASIYIDNDFYGIDWLLLCRDLKVLSVENYLVQAGSYDADFTKDITSGY